jgi:hypothetical protein
MASASERACRQEKKRIEAAGAKADDVSALDEPPTQVVND